MTTVHNSTATQPMPSRFETYSSWKVLTLTMGKSKMVSNELNEYMNQMKETITHLKTLRDLKTTVLNVKTGESYTFSDASSLKLARELRLIGPSETTVTFTGTEKTVWKSAIQTAQQSANKESNITMALVNDMGSRLDKLHAMLSAIVKEKRDNQASIVSISRNS